MIRRSIMMSMALTGERYLTAEGAALYSHDDYDAAHTALGELLAENKELRVRLKLACEPCAECGHIDWRELDDILEKT